MTRPVSSFSMMLRTFLAVLFESETVWKSLRVNIRTVIKSIIQYLRIPCRKFQNSVIPLIGYIQKTLKRSVSTSDIMSFDNSTNSANTASSILLFVNRHHLITLQYLPYPSKSLNPSQRPSTNLLHK